MIKREFFIHSNKENKKKKRILNFHVTNEYVMSKDTPTNPREDIYFSLCKDNEDEDFSLLLLLPLSSCPSLFALCEEMCNCNYISAILYHLIVNQ